jgi:uncharacterized membrane protein YecN with MAPEG domain
VNGGPASFFYAGLLGLRLVALSAQVVLARRRYRVGLGAGSEEGLQQAIRVQANFVEYVPFAVILLVLAELTGLPLPALHGAGILLVAAGSCTRSGLESPGRSFGRFYGTADRLVIVALSPGFSRRLQELRSPAPG